MLPQADPNETSPGWALPNVQLSPIEPAERESRRAPTGNRALGFRNHRVLNGMAWTWGCVRPLGAVLALSWGSLGRSGAPVGPPGAILASLGGPGGRFGVFWSRPGAFWGPLGDLFGCLGALFGCLEPLRAPPVPPLGPSGVPLVPPGAPPGVPWYPPRPPQTEEGFSHTFCKASISATRREGMRCDRPTDRRRPTTTTTTDRPTGRRRQRPTTTDDDETEQRKAAQTDDLGGNSEAIRWQFGAIRRNSEEKNNSASQRPTPW